MPKSIYTVFKVDIRRPINCVFHYVTGQLFPPRAIPIFIILESPHPLQRRPRPIFDFIFGVFIHRNLVLFLIILGIICIRIRSLFKGFFFFIYIPSIKNKIIFRDAEEIRSQIISEKNSFSILIDGSFPVDHAAKIMNSLLSTHRIFPAGNADTSIINPIFLLYTMSIKKLF